MTYILSNALPMVCIICSTAIIYQGKDGWGWLLLIALLTSHTFGKTPKEPKP